MRERRWWRVGIPARRDRVAAGMAFLFRALPLKAEGDLGDAA
jgi:hypothetical protein